MKRAVVWAGVSSKPQAQDDRDSLATQLAEGLALCERNGWQPVARLVVPGITRSHIDLQDAIAAVDEALGADRSGLFARQLADLGADGENAYRRLAELIAARQVDVLICRSRDRLGRTDSLIAGIEERLRRAGAVVYSLAMPPTGTAGGDLYLSAVERAGGQHYVLQLVEATRRGMDNRAARGLPLAGPLPFGFRAAWGTTPSGRLARRAEADDDEAGAYRWAVAETLAGSLRQVDIIERLRGRFPERQWSASALTGILRSPFYLGLVLRRRAWMDYDRALLKVAGDGGALADPAWPEIEALLLRRVQSDGKARGNSRPGRRVYVLSPGQHQALIDPPTWLEVQRLLDSRALSRRPASPRGLWAGILRCGVCGVRLYVDARRDKAGREYVNYRCGSRLTAERCGNPGLSERKATRLIAQHLRPILAEYTPDADPPPLPGADRSESLARELAGLTERRGRLIMLFETGRITLEEFDARERETAAQVAQVEADLQALRDAAGRGRRRAGRLALLAEILPTLEERLLAAPVTEANALLRQIFTEITIAHGEVTGVDMG